jgi:hypothetical protein
MAMQKITFSADADLLERAEQIAKAKGTTLCGIVKATPCYETRVIPQLLSCCPVLRHPSRI